MSEEPESFDEWQLEAMASVQEYFRRVSPIVSFTLRRPYTMSIDRFLAMTNESPTAEAFRRWGEFHNKRKQILVDGINSNARSSLAISAYNCHRIRQIDNSIIEALQGFSMRRNEVVAGGDMTVLNAEYQAFILACRRCLDQLTYALSALYKNQCVSFRRFGNWLLKQDDEIGVSRSLASIYNAHRPNFDGWLMKDGDSSRSIRDDLAHYRSISVGTLNVSLGGLLLAGMDAPQGAVGDKHLPDVVLGLFQQLSACVDEMVGNATDHFSSFLIQKYSLQE
ncbi:hypothetical protein [Mesorhizobium sp. 113-3-9]|uniref:hypothetical protein n=1 Tax=Mesorhizobium sp. 113-3-9 TaxID=2744517 RepID=UPI001928B963|nr:hypothetical protein [Mesorhizobium sp. 113-3-9]